MIALHAGIVEIGVATCVPSRNRKLASRRGDGDIIDAAATPAIFSRSRRETSRPKPEYERRDDRGSITAVTDNTPKRDGGADRRLIIY